MKISEQIKLKAQHAVPSDPIAALYIKLILETLDELDTKVDHRTDPRNFAPNENTR